MWNPWKWGDVMPSQHQRPGFNGRRRNEQHLVIDKSNVTPSPTQSAIPASAPNIPTWNFRRLSSSQSDEVASPPEGTNVSELDEPPTETAESINQQNTTNTPIEGAPKSFDMILYKGQSNSGHPPANHSSNGTVFEEAGQDQQTADIYKEKKSVTIITDKSSDNDEQQTPIKSKIDGAETGKGSPNALVIPNPKSSQSPLDYENDSTSASPQSTFFGFFDKDKHSSSSTCEESIDKNEAAEGANTGTKSSSKKDDTEHSPSTSEWYPSMMERNNYDFRDRRLDY